MNVTPQGRKAFTSDAPTPVAIVGARGYSGLELAKHALAHPRMRLVACGHSGSASSAGWKLSDDLAVEHAALVPTLGISELLALKGADKPAIVFLATPAEASIELAPQFLDKGMDVIDLSGAFRLPAQTYRLAYGQEPAAVALQARAEYGLVPFASPASRVHGARLIANPGCYATATLLALIPLLKAGLIDPASVVVDAKSGASGAGRKASESLLFTEVADDCRPYRVGNHQHEPEIIRHAATLAGADFREMMFTPHLLPIHSGILVSLYARLSARVSSTQAQDTVAQAYSQSYAGYPLVRHGHFGAFKHQSLARMRGTPYAHISYQVTTSTEGSPSTRSKLAVFCSIDNLQKGAASQAIENFNRLMDLPVETGLIAAQGNAAFYAQEKK